MRESGIKHSVQSSRIKSFWRLLVLSTYRGRKVSSTVASQELCVELHYITLHYITLHYITLHHCITLHLNLIVMYLVVNSTFLPYIGDLIQD